MKSRSITKKTRNRFKRYGFLASVSLLIFSASGCGSNAKNNSAPTASAFAVTAVGNTVKNVNWKTSSSAHDPDNDVLSVTVKTQPTMASFAIAGDTLTITPAASQQGNDSGVITISDGNGGTVDVTVTLQGIDTLAPSKTAESFPTLDTAGNSGSGTISFDEPVQTVPSATFRLASDNSSAAGITSVSGTGTNTITVNYTAPNLSGSVIYIELLVTDSVGNQRTVRTNNYTIL